MQFGSLMQAVYLYYKSKGMVKNSKNRAFHLGITMYAERVYYG